MIKILLLMLLLHIVDDFVLQPVCLSKLKQREWWKKQDEYCEKYKNDHKMALFMHSLSWSLMILLPLMFMANISDLWLTCAVIFNMAIHFMVDDFKANRRKINLVQDQIIHLMQIVLTWIICCC